MQKLLNLDLDFMRWKLISKKRLKMREVWCCWPVKTWSKKSRAKHRAISFMKHNWESFSNSLISIRNRRMPMTIKLKKESESPLKNFIDSAQKYSNKRTVTLKHRKLTNQSSKQRTSKYQSCNTNLTTSSTRSSIIPSKSSWFKN